MTIELDRQKVEAFLFREARLMDEHKYGEWLALWDEQATYWVPCGGEWRDPAREVSIIYDNRQKLEDRIARFLSGDVLAQDPPRPMRRVLSNVEILDVDENEATVVSNFLLVQAAVHEEVVWAGQSTHRLKRRDGGFAIRFKKVVLVNNGIEMPLLQFLI